MQGWQRRDYRPLNSRFAAKDAGKAEILTASLYDRTGQRRLNEIFHCD
jgi:hypothetical protein